ncbi:hypothetical protein D5R81_16440 [Parashewanella spongiae]|uniref:Uncharacterized protein n=1 Tax=Parashewanella spongiae TaxID=342950 RepID=A0A3A6THG1_9GAMM|nr:hypothetical protein [Parashewanella spongiae]MCL1079707.1 hypothetical protein [Parashewanella spongiae]RJY07177.1 hypothetical protein D5R81_16440 [Parashewanella spongiae]
MPVITNEFRDKLFAGFVGFNIELSSIESKLKLGQYRKADDQVDVYNALTNSQVLSAPSLVKYMKKPIVTGS